MARKLFVILWLLLGAAGLAAPRQAPPKPDAGDRAEREIYVPFDNLNILLEDGAHHVLLDRDEYDKLVQKARRKEAQRPPLAALLASADYQVALGQERAAITGKLELEVLDEGLHAIRLDLGGIGLRALQVDGESAAIGRGADGRLRLFVEGKGRRQLKLEAVAPLQTTAARQVLHFQLPTPAATSLRLTAPGDVEVKSGAAVARRVFDGTAGETRFDLLPKSGPLSLVMTLNSRLKRKERVVVARGVYVDELTEANEQLHATISFSILHRAVGDLEFAVPAGFEVTSVASPELARWVIRRDGGRRIVTATLREEVTGTIVLAASARRTRPALRGWRLPRFEPLDVAGEVAIVGLLVEDRLKVEGLEAAGLIPIDHQVLSQAMPQTFSTSRGRRAAAAYYAPQAKFSLAANLYKPPAKLRVTGNLLLILGKSGLEAKGGFAVRPEEEIVFGLDFTVPAGWDVTTVADDGGAALAFERHPATGGASRVRVQLPKGVAVGRERRIFFTAVNVPPGWLEPWQSRGLAFPVFAAVGAARDVGAIAVEARDDMRARPAALENLTPLDEAEKKKYGLEGAAASLAYRYESQPYSASLEIERTTPRLTAETYSFFRLEQDALTAHYELVYTIEQARQQRLALVLPSDTPAALSISGLAGVTVKEYTSKDIDNGRRWEVLLAQAQSGEARLAVDFVQPLVKGDEGEVVLPLVRAADVAYQSGLLAVEGHAELDVRIDQHPRRVDVGELIDASYRPGPRLLGAFGFVGEPPAVKLQVKRHPGYALPPAIVQRAELATTLSANGLSQSSARFLLRTKSLFLQVMLPPDAVLWSVTLDGKPAQPQQQGGSILLGLPAGAPGVTRDLRVVYETPSRQLVFWDRLELPAPRLFLHASETGAGVELPVVDLNWQLYLPTGFKVVQSAGAVTPDAVEPPTMAATRLVRFLYGAAGGLAFRRGLLGGCLQLVGGTLMKARSSRRVYSFGREQSVGDVAAGGAEAPPAALEDDGEDLGQALKEESEVQLGAKLVRKRPAGRGKKQDRKASVASKKAAVWALEGARSLKIDLAATGPAIIFRGLGDQPRLDLAVSDNRRLGALALALALGVVLAGLALTRAPAKRQATYVATIMLAATLLPVVPGLLGLAVILNPAFYAASALVPYYLLAALLRRLPWRRNSAPAAGTVLLAGLLVAGLLTAAAPPAAAKGPAKQPAPLVFQVAPPPPVVLPADALILPYDPASETGIDGATRVLVPQLRYQQLWDLANPRERLATRKPPAPYALSGLKLTGDLQDGEFLVLTGRLDIDVYTEELVAVPLPLEGAVVASAVLDGKPARLGVAPGHAPVVVDQRQTKRRPAPTAIHLYAGKGRHRLDLAIRVKLERRGGWRIANARLPAAAAMALDLRLPRAGTELRLSHVPDRPSYQSKVAGELIRTAIGADGRVAIQWRPKVSEGQVDQALTAESNVLFDVQEDRSQLVWALTLRFRRGEREFFSLELPGGYLVEKVAGDNVRGWEVRQDGDRQRLEVGLLKPAKQSESFNVHLWRPGPIAAQRAETLAVPVVGVSGALRHSGALTIRRSPRLELRTVAKSGVSRSDLGQVKAVATRESPLGIRPYQAYTFVAAPFTLQLQVSSSQARIVAAAQTIIRLAERERTLESRVRLTVRERPIYRAELLIPADLELDDVTAPGDSQWAVARRGAEQALTIYFAVGLQGEVPIIIRGRLGESGKVTEVAVPRLEVLGVERQSGDIVVQTDPAFTVQPRNLEGLESIFLRRVYGWLQSGQRRSAKLALHYASAKYSGRLLLQTRTPSVNCYTVSNVRVTDRTIEETILLAFRIAGAGIREVRFLLPARLAAAKITVPLLRQKTVERLPDAEQVRVTLELQDEVTNELRVLIENDRLLTAEEHAVPIPTVETGRTDRRYVALESAGRDEVVIGEPVGLARLNRQQKEWRTVAALLRGGSTIAYIVKPEAKQPQLTFHTKERVTVETAGARIGLAQTVLVLDSAGAFRGEQVYHMANQTEQSLDLELPAGASLWTAMVAGQPVKPIVAGGSQSSRVSLPLVKTAAGDLDYTIVLKYGGKLPGLGNLRSVAFPLIRTLNVNVELSQVELRLPRTHHWLRFGGAMRRVDRPSDFHAGRVGYQVKVLSRLLQTLRYGSQFAQARARVNCAGNLKQIGLDLLMYSENNEGFFPTQGQAGQVMKEVQAELEKAGDVGIDPDLSVMNVFAIDDFVQRQKPEAAKNKVQDTLSNWGKAAAPVRRAPQTAQAFKFNSKWIDENALQTDGGQKVAAEEIAAPANAPQQPATVHFYNVQPDAPAIASAKKPQARAAGRTSRAFGGGKGGQNRRRSQQELVLQYAKDLEVRQKTGKPTGGEQTFARHARDGASTDALATGIPGPGLLSRGDAVAAMPERGLKSLQVALPPFDGRRWERHLFTTPRGEVEITGRPVSEPTLEGLKRLGTVLAAILIVLGLRRLGRGRGSSLGTSRAAPNALIIGGAIGLLLGVFPIAAALALIGGIVWRIVGAVARRRQALA